MKKEEQHFFELLKQSNQLKKSNKSLASINIKTFNSLVISLVTIEENLHYCKREEYIKLLENVLDEKITLTDFCYNFTNIYKETAAKRQQLEEEESLELKNLLNPSRRELGKLLLEMSYICNDFLFDLEISQEEKLKNCAKLLLLKLRE